MSEPIFNHVHLGTCLDELRKFTPAQLSEMQERTGYILYNGEDPPTPRIPRGFERVCVQVDRKYDNIKALAGANGELIELEINPEYQPLHYVREYGTVMARPFASDETFLVRQGSPNQVQVGDRVYMHYHAITDEYEYRVDGLTYYLIPYEMCYCVVREGRVIMLNDFVLTQPIVLGAGEQATPTGIIFNPHTDERLDARAATVAFAPLRVDSSIVPGRQVYFLSDADLPLTVEGTKYFIMHASDIIGFEDPA